MRGLLVGSYRTASEADVISVRPDSFAWGERYIGTLDEFWLFEMLGVAQADAAFLAEDYVYLGENRGRLWQLDSMRALPGPVRTRLASGQTFVVNMAGQTFAQDDVWGDGRTVAGSAPWTVVRNLIVRRDSLLEPTDQTTHGVPGGTLSGLVL